METNTSVSSCRFEPDCFRADTILTACDSYSLPAHVRPHVDIVLPSVNFDARVLPKGHPGSPVRRAERLARRSAPDGNSLSGAPKANIHAFAKTLGTKSKGREDPNDLSNCDEEITPACLRALYNFENVHLVATNKNSYGIGTFCSFL